MNDIKHIYDFIVYNEENVEVIKETDNGKLHTTELKRIPKTIVMKEPSRQEMEELETAYAVAMSNSIRKGIMTKAMLAKFYAENGGVMTQEEGRKLAKLYDDYAIKQLEFQRLALNSQKNDERLTELTAEIMVLYTAIQDVETLQSGIFDQTAETRSRNKAVEWCMMNLTYVIQDIPKEGGEVTQRYIPFFGDGSMEDRLEQYDTMLAVGNEFDLKVINKIAIMFAFWYLGRAVERNDFDTVMDSIDPGYKTQAE